MAIKIIIKNKRAFFDYFIKEKFEAGLVLQGTEVKSLRTGKVAINESHIIIDNSQEAWICNMSIPQYEHGNRFNHQEDRRRKLLLHKKEIFYLQHQIKAGGMAIIPICIYFKKSQIKLEIALAKGKKKYDKRQAQAQKDIERKLRQGRYD
ncbi:MAG: SsrA-binding protein SmpB [Halobacteriovoraceae bacterium]|nr:SsrA-binding protein SmpB [Halobacteriovoraceae bacterium]